MRFISVPRRATYVVRPKSRTVDALGMPHPVRGLAAKFRNHVFDSDVGQKENGWNDEERRVVENHLLTHSDFNAHNGYYVDRIVEGEASQGQSMSTPASVGPLGGAPTTACTMFFRNEKGEPEQCALQAVEGSDYCAGHDAEVKAEAAKMEAMRSVASTGTEG